MSLKGRNTLKPLGTSLTSNVKGRFEVHQNTKGTPTPNQVGVFFFSLSHLQVVPQFPYQKKNYTNFLGLVFFSRETNHKKS